MLQVYVPPTLYGLSSTGKVKSWYVEVSQLGDGTSLLEVTHGYLDGKKSGSSRIIESGKNLGKSNETTPFQQAVSEADSLWNKKKDEGYVEDKNNIPKSSDVELFLPMLAHRYDQRGKDIKFPAAVQPKLDGVRNLAHKQNGKVTIWSRKGKIFDVPVEIIDELNQVLDEGDCADGEIYVHAWHQEDSKSNEGRTKFQRIIAALKARNEDTANLEYHIYDVPNSNKSFADRYFEFWNKISSRLGTESRIKFVETVIIQSEEQMLEKFSEFLLQKYEGLMVRNLEGRYQYKNRSMDLQKVKTFQDEEFLIIGGKEASGNDVGTVVFRCETADGKGFDVRPRGERSQRAEWWQNLHKYVGSWLTIQYQGISDEGIPRFPVGVVIRNFE